MISMIIAQTGGIFLFILGIIMLSCPQRFKTVLKNLDYKSEGLLYNNIATLLLGCLLMVVHNNWSTPWLCAISALGWIMLFKGILWLIAPQEMIRVAHQFSGGVWYLVACALTIVAGAILLTIGFAPIMHTL